jgi:tRNA A-37 threonylcarbamoyl transferase component Bud32
MDSPQFLPNDDRFHGTVAGREVLELVRMLHRTCVTGTLHLTGRGHTGTVRFILGAVRAAAFDAITGPPALARLIVIGQAEFRFELAPAAASTTAEPGTNISKDTASILDAVERMLAEYPPERLWQAGKPGEPAAAAAPAGKRNGTSARIRARKGDHPTTRRHAPDPDATQAVRIFAPPEPGTVLGRCTLREELGRGGSAVVYRAEHASLGLDVVVKVLMPTFGDESHRLMTANEARLLARLNHPAILRIFDFHDQGDFPHLVMELADGPSLAALIERHQRLPGELALPLFYQVAEALAYAHETVGLVHGDIKPSNILTTSDEQVKIADFGLAKSTLAAKRPSTAVVTAEQGFDGLFQHGRVAGTPSYIAPEQVEGGRAAADQRSDIYALGATIYHAVTGRTPFADPDPIQLMVKRLSEAPIPPHLVHPGVERRLSQLIMSMMARDPSNRIQSHAELLELLGDLLATLPQGDLPGTAARGGARGDSEGKIIRRRTSFWSYVPNRLLRRASSDAADAG